MSQIGQMYLTMDEVNNYSFDLRHNLEPSYIQMMVLDNDHKEDKVYNPFYMIRNQQKDNPDTQGKQAELFQILIYINLLVQREFVSQVYLENYQMIYLNNRKDVSMSHEMI